jgi:hypothetical protein
MPNLGQRKSLANNTLYRYGPEGVNEKAQGPGNFGDSDIKTACADSCKKMR